MNNLTSLDKIVSFLNTELEVARYSDMAINGLQIESPRDSILKVSFAVDAGQSVIEEALTHQAQLLVVHHGVFWGKLEPIVGAWAKKVTTCLTNGLSLYAAHLPLDGHPVLGNAAQMATTLLDAVQIESDFDYKGAPLGVTARLKTPLPIEEIAQILGRSEGAYSNPLVLPFGKKIISTLGIITGSGTSMIPHGASRKVDLFITGEPKQEAYHIARELECSVIFMGHYASETFGVRALQRILESRFGVETSWISQPTGI